MNKKNCWCRTPLIALAGAVLGIASLHASAMPQYTLQDLGTLGGSSSVALGINNSGQVVGLSYLSGNAGPRAVLFGTGGAPNIDLGGLGGSYSIARDISDSGQIVGQAASQSGGPASATLFVTDGTSNLDLDGPGAGGAAFAINNTGKITGTLSSRPVGYGTGVAPSFLGTSLGEANDVNDAGVAVGAIHGSTGPLPVAFDAVTGLPSALSLPAWASGGTAFGVNESGIAVGTVGNASASHAVAFDIGAGTVTELGTLGGNFSIAMDVNEAGAVVGYGNSGSGAFRAFLWEQTAGMVDLNTLLVTLSDWTVAEAYAINDSGQIAAVGRRGSETRALLLTPVPAVSDPTDLPEPHVLGLVGLSFIAIGVVSRRRVN